MLFCKTKKFINRDLHPLHIEYGRYNKTPRNERYCKMCSLNQIEDEFHALMLCPKYNNIRQKLFSDLNDEFLFNNCNTNDKKFRFILQAPNKK